jgi:antitoxin StbD
MPVKFTAAGLEMDKVSTKIANKIKHGAMGEYEEWR